MELIKRIKLIDRVHRVPRIWSNSELIKMSSYFKGDVINVSGWKDEDKEGGHYKEYFFNANSYSISNFSTEDYGYQGNIKNEIFLDLESNLPSELEAKYDVVFNHTVLEHVFDIFKAFSNLCLLTKDITVIVVPFIQQQHTEYGDYWRLTPLALARLFEKNKMKMVYVNFNDSENSSIYVFAVGTKNPDRWKIFDDFTDNKIALVRNKKDYYIGTKIIKNSKLFYLLPRITKLLKKLRF